MKFEEILPALKEGKKIRRNNPSWLNSVHYIFLGCDIYGAQKIRLKYLEGGPETYIICSSDLKADDWEIVKEPKRVKLRDLTKKQLEKWLRTNCNSSKCNNCLFNKVDYGYAYCWIKDNYLFDDKFLDQEIEIDDDD